MHKCLIPTLNKHQMPYDIEAIDNLGDWNKNTGYKATLILRMLQKHKQDICFIDADAVIVNYPKLLYSIPDEYDLAAHILNWYGHWRNQWDRTDNMHLLSGTMVFKYKPIVIELVKKWIEQNQTANLILEQKILQEIIESNSRIKLYELPPEYCVVVMRDYTIPKYIKHPIYIIHTQCSRKYRKEVDLRLKFRP